MNHRLPVTLADIMTCDVRSVTPETSLQEVAKIMSEAGISSLLIGPLEKTLGIITESTILRAMHWRLPSHTAVSEVMSQPLVTAPPDLGLLGARKLIEAHSIRHLVVVAPDGATIGIVSETDFRRHLGVLAFQHLQTLASAMDREMPHLPPSSNLDAALTRMLQRASDYILVSEHGKPLGILTERDIPRLLSCYPNACEIPLGQAMSAPVHNIHVKQSVNDALNAMSVYRVRHMVVVSDDGEVAGVISQSRLFEQLAMHEMETTLNRLCEERDRLRLEAQLNLALSAAGAGAWEYRPRHDRVVCSNSLLALFGENGGSGPLNLAEWRERIHPQDRQHYDVAVDSVLREKMGQHRMEYRIRHAWGQWLWVEDRGCVTERDHEGLPTVVSGILTDIGQRRADRRRIERQNRSLHLLGGIARSVVRESDETALLAAVCRLAVDIGGYRSARFIAADEPMPATQEADYILPVHNDGERVGVLLLGIETGHSIDDEEAELLDDLASELGIGIGKQRSRRAQAASEASLRQLSLAIEQSPHSIIITRTDGSIEYVNQAFVACTGYPPEEIIGRNPRLLKSDQTSRRTLAELWQSLLRGDIWRGEFINRRKDGSLYNAHAIITPVRQKNGEVTHYLAIEEDITERKRDQAELAKYRQELEGLVDQRTRQLQHAKEEAEAANRAKSSFLANMSHEIRTPMNAILGLTHLLQRDIAATDASERLGRIADAANQLMQLLNDILDLSRLEAGNLTPSNGEFSLAELLAETRQQFADKARSKNLGLDSLIAPNLPARLGGDAQHIRQILLQLLANAIKFTESGSITIRVEAQAREGDRLRLRFSVSDTGIGIDRATQSRLFNPFEQADSSTTRRHGGAGLGLVISRRLAELMGGNIGVNSAPGEGSEFWFVLPLQVIDTGAQTLPAPAAASVTAPDTAGDADALDYLARIPGLDPKTGLHAVRGKLATYQRLLSTFADNHVGDFPRMHELFALGELEEARRLAHSIKGAAGTLGATAVFQSAADLDHAIRQQRPAEEIARLIVDCESSYQQLHAALAGQRQAAQASMQQGSGATTEELRRQLTSLSQQLKDCDFAVQGRLQTEARMLQQVLGEAFGSFERKIADFDFEAAAEQLDQALARLS